MKICGFKPVSIFKKQNGFTLVELLVVISIIAMLLAVLMPALRKVKQSARQVFCQSQLKQLTVAWILYLNENDQNFFQRQNANLNYGGWRGIKGAVPTTAWPNYRPLNPYLSLPTDIEIDNFTTPEELKIEEKTKAFLCPSDKGGYRPTLVQFKVYKAVGTSYQTNIFLIGQNSCAAFSSWTYDLDEQISSRLKDMTTYRVNNPSIQLLIGDYGWINQWKPRTDPNPEWKELAEWHGKENWYNLAFLGRARRLP